MGQLYGHRLEVLELGVDFVEDVLANVGEVPLEPFAEVLRDVETAVADVDVVVCQQFLDEEDEVPRLSGRQDGWHLDLLYELLKSALLLLPLLNLQGRIHPLRSIAAQDIDGLAVFALFLLHVEYCLALLPLLGIRSR